MEYNIDLYKGTSSMLLLFTASTAALLLYIVDKIWYLVTCEC